MSEKNLKGKSSENWKSEIVKASDFSMDFTTSPDQTSPIGKKLENIPAKNAMQ